MTQRHTEQKDLSKINSITREVIGCAMKVHDALGPGLLESTYEACLAYELEKAGLIEEKQMPMPVVYEEVKLPTGYRVDLLVENRIYRNSSVAGASMYRTKKQISNGRT